jgi:hypothetical protein
MTLNAQLAGSAPLVPHSQVDVSRRALTGEVHAGRVLEGRAVQDVWIMPRRADRTAESDPTMNMYGTTLRSWDASILVAHRVDQSDPRPLRSSDWQLEWQGHSSDR